MMALGTLVDRPRGLGRDVARNAAGEGELAKQPAHALLIPSDVGVDLAVGPLQVHVGDDPWATVARARDIKRVHITLANHPVHVRVDEVQAGGRAPMAKQTRLYVLDS